MYSKGFDQDLSVSFTLHPTHYISDRPSLFAQLPSVGDWQKTLNSWRLEISWSRRRLMSSTTDETPYQTPARTLVIISTVEPELPSPLQLTHSSFPTILTFLLLNSSWKHLCRLPLLHCYWLLLCINNLCQALSAVSTKCVYFCLWYQFFCLSQVLYYYYCTYRSLSLCLAVYILCQIQQLHSLAII